MQQPKSALRAFSIQKGKSDNGRGPIRAIVPDCRQSGRGIETAPRIAVVRPPRGLVAPRQVIDRARLRLPELNPHSITLKHFACRRAVSYAVSCAALCPQRHAAQRPLEPGARCVIAGLVTHTVHAPHFDSVAPVRLVLTFRFSSGCCLLLPCATADPQLCAALAASRLLTSWVW